MKLYLTRNEAAELLGVTPQTISNYLAKGLLVESTTRNPESKAIRILGSSVRNLMKEGYDIIEQYKAMEACQKEVRQMREDLAIQKDELEKTHQLMASRDKFYNNIREVAEILTAFLKGNDILQGIREEYVIDLLSGKRWEHVAWRKGVSKASIRSIYVKALRLLADGKKPSNAELKDEIANIKIQLDLEKKRNAVLEEIVREKQVDDDIMKIVDERIIRIPHELVGFRHIPMSVRLYNIMRARDLEHFYELALVSRKFFTGARNCGNKTLNEAILLMEKIGLEFNDIESLNSKKVQSLPGPYIEVSVGALKARNKELIERFG